jgi:hypothetical protein
MASQSEKGTLGKLPDPPPGDAPLADWAIWCADVGRICGAWKVFPCAPGRKHPLHKGWQDEATSDRKIIETMWRNDPEANIGLAIQPGFVAIDADIYKSGAEAALDAFKAEHGSLPLTLTNSTARGGYHLIYSTTKTLGNGKGTLPNFGDVRGHGGLIVGPGSKFKGSRYTVKNLRFPEALPEHIEAMLCARKRRDRSDPDDPVPGVTVDDPHNVQYFADWCAGKPVRTIATPNGEVANPCIEGQGGNNMLAATGAVAHDYGLSADVGYVTALEHHNPRCEPPWDDDEYERHFCSGYSSASSPLGHRAPNRSYGHLFKPHVVTSDGERVADLPHQLSELPERETRAFYYLGMLDTIPEPTWTIDGILPEGGYSLIYGKRSTMKSFLALDMGLCLATGKRFHGRNVKRGRVVYFAGEGFRGNSRRIKAWFKRHTLKPEDYARDFALVPFTSKWDKPQGYELVRQVLTEIAEDGPLSLVIIDTARRAMSGDENAPTSVGAFLDGVSDICREFGCGHLIVHHAGKDESKGARGGGPFEDDADAVFHVTKNTGGAVRFKCTKQKDDEDDWTMTFRANFISLGGQPNDRPITSLTLVLECECKAEDGDGGTTSSDRERYAPHDAIAIQILEGLLDPSAKRGELAKAVMDEMEPEQREDDPNASRRALRAYRAHLTRLSKTHSLWPYIDQRNDKGEALTFRSPKHRGRRAAKPSRRKTLNYNIPNQKPEED